MGIRKVKSVAGFRPDFGAQMVHVLLVPWLIPGGRLPCEQSCNQQRQNIMGTPTHEEFVSPRLPYLDC